VCAQGFSAREWIPCMQQIRRLLMVINVQVLPCCFAPAMRFRNHYVPLLHLWERHDFGVGAVRGGFRQGHLQTARPATLLIRGQRFIRRSVQNASAGNTIGKTLAFGSVACDVRFDDSSSSFCIWSDRPRSNRRQAAGIRSKRHACLAQLGQPIRSHRPQSGYKKRRAT
jgi:hypothetical protein